MSISLAHLPCESYFIKLIALFTVNYSNYVNFINLIKFESYFIKLIALLTVNYSNYVNFINLIKLVLLNYFINLFLDFKSLNLYL